MEEKGPKSRYPPVGKTHITPFRRFLSTLSGGYRVRTVSWFRLLVVLRCYSIITNIATIILLEVYIMVVRLQHSSNHVQNRKINMLQTDQLTDG